jgi:four helix bundle protein
MKVRNYRDLIVWQRAMELAESVYALTRKLPKEERYGLASQLQRAAVSIPSNISEGHARSHGKEFLHHRSFARGSLAELETQLLLASRLQYVRREDLAPCWSLAQEVGKMLRTMINSM